jgi:hypothetical protein
LRFNIAQAAHPLKRVLARASGGCFRGVTPHARLVRRSRFIENGRDAAKAIDRCPRF